MTTMTETRAERRQRAINILNEKRTIPLERYKEDGCNSRFEYLESIADNSGLKLSTVIQLAQLLGPDEDFDGLVTSCEDAEGMEDL